MENQKILKFLEHFSVITVGENKIPNFSWTKQQTDLYHAARQRVHRSFRST